MRRGEEQIGFLLFCLAIARTGEPRDRRTCSNRSSKTHAKWMLFLCAKKPTNTTTCKRRRCATVQVFHSIPESMCHMLSCMQHRLLHGPGPATSSKSIDAALACPGQTTTGPAEPAGKQA